MNLTLIGVRERVNRALSEAVDESDERTQRALQVLVDASDDLTVVTLRITAERAIKRAELDLQGARNMIATLDAGAARSES